jgi:NADPH:quinone reductase-like Zn-dependent oxidoreductase
MKRYELAKVSGIDDVQLVERETPKPGPGQVLVRMRAASLNYRDLLMVSGMYARGGLPLPLVPVSDGAGEIVEVADGVTRAKPGDRVVLTFFEGWSGGSLTEREMGTARGGARPGVLSEFVVSPEDALLPIPAHLSFEEAATLPCAALTAWQALAEIAPAIPGETVLALGTGGVSIFALQLAKLLGARVILTSSSDDKLARARALGADETINYKTTPDWEKAVRELTVGRGVDRVIEVGGPGTFQKSIASLRMGGRLALIGVLGGLTGGVEILPILLGCLHVDGVYVGSREMFERMNRAVELAKLRPVIDRTFPFDEAPAAYRHLQSGAHFGKIVIRIS